MTIDLLNEYIYEYSIFTINQEVNERLFQLECGMVNESMGLMSLTEGFIDTLKDWFAKIIETVEKVINKLKGKISGLWDNTLSKLGKTMNNPNKTDPETLNIPITNYHEYDFTKFRDGTYDTNKIFTNPNFLQVVNGLIGGSTEKPENTDKKSILRSLYPNLSDDNLSIFDKMRQSMLVSGKDTNQETQLSIDMLDNAWNFVSEEFKGLIVKIEQDKDVMAAQRKNVDAAAQQLANIIQNKQGAIKKESYVFCEQYITEAPEQEKDIKNQKIDADNTGVSKDVYAKALMGYIQVATDIISSKIKVVNSAFMDKFRIVTYYCKRAK